MDLVGDTRSQTLVINVQRHGSITEVTAAWGEGLSGSGSSRCSKHDVFLAEIGETIALGRAVADLGRKIELFGHAQCVTKDEFCRVNHLLERRKAARWPAIEKAMVEGLMEDAEAEKPTPKPRLTASIRREAEKRGARLKP